MNIYKLTKCLAMISGISIIGLACGMQNNPQGDNSISNNQLQKSEEIKKREIAIPNCSLGKYKGKLNDLSLLKVLQYLPPKENYTLAQTCKRIGKIIQVNPAAKLNPLAEDITGRKVATLKISEVYDAFKCDETDIGLLSRPLNNWINVFTENGGKDFLDQQESPICRWFNKAKTYEYIEHLVLICDSAFVFGIDAPDTTQYTQYLDNTFHVSLPNILAVINHCLPNLKRIFFDHITTDDAKQLSNFLDNKKNLDNLSEFEEKIKTSNSVKSKVLYNASEILIHIIEGGVKVIYRSMDGMYSCCLKTAYEKQLSIDKEEGRILPKEEENGTTSDKLPLNTFPIKIDDTALKFYQSIKELQNEFTNPNDYEIITSGLRISKYEFNKINDNTFKEKPGSYRLKNQLEYSFVDSILSFLKNQVLNSVISSNSEKCKEYLTRIIFNSPTYYRDSITIDMEKYMSGQLKNAKRGFNLNLKENDPKRNYDVFLKYCTDTVINLYFSDPKSLITRRKLAEQPTRIYGYSTYKYDTSDFFSPNLNFTQDANTYANCMTEILNNGGYEQLFDKVFNLIKQKAKNYDNPIMQIVNEILSGKDVKEDIKYLHTISNKNTRDLTQEDLDYYNDYLGACNLEKFPDELADLNEDQKKVLEDIYCKYNLEELSSANFFKTSNPLVEQIYNGYNIKTQAIMDISELQATYKFIKDILAVAKDHEINIKITNEINMQNLNKLNLYDFIRLARDTIIAIEEKSSSKLEVDINEYFSFLNDNVSLDIDTCINRLNQLIETAEAEEYFTSTNDAKRLLQQLAYFTLNFFSLNTIDDSKGFLYCKLKI